MILDQAAKFQSMAMSGVDSQHLETRKHHIDEICRILRVFPQMVGHAGNQAPTFASADSFFLAHVIHTLLPWVARWEQAIKRDLLSGQGEDSLIAKFNINGLLRGDAASRGDFYLKALGGARAETLETITVTGTYLKNIDPASPLCDRFYAAAARLMARAGQPLIREADIIIPVPLHRFRLWSRRFNQAAFLSQQISRQFGKAYRSDVLLRTTASRSQVGLSFDERRKNVAKVFHAAPEGFGHIAGRRVLLVDDVLTTGATAGSCAVVLKKAGAVHVDVLTFALVLEPKRPHIG